MKGKGLIWVLTGLIMVIVITIILFSLNTEDLQLGKAKVDKLTEGKIIKIDSKAENFGIQKGDVFIYYVDILYNPKSIIEINKAKLIEDINLQPFEIRSINDSELELADGTCIYRMEYEIQLIDGETDYLYEFPNVVVAYKLVGSEGFQELPSFIEPVYVSSRMPESEDDFIDFGYEAYIRPLYGEIQSTGDSNLSWILLTSGSLLIIGTIANYVFNIIPQMRRKKEREISDKNKQISRAYNALYKNIEKGISDENILYQVGHIVRLALVKNEDIEWLDEMYKEKFPIEIREEINYLLYKYPKKGIEKLPDNDMEKSLQNLDRILKFYYAEDVDIWRS